MPIATLTNAKLHYRIEGDAHAPLVVLSNSLGSDLAMWDAQMAGLTQHLRVLRYDTRGHGGSPATLVEPSPKDLARDVLELVDDVAPTVAGFHVCGISLGGMTALQLAIDAPDRVLSIMPCNTAARIGSYESWTERIEQVRADGLAALADATMQRWFTPAFRAQEPEQVEAMRRVFVHTDPAGYIACCAALRDADLTAEIASIAAPTYVISGTHDPVTPPVDGHFLERNIHGAVYRELNAAHLSNIEQPAAFLDAMLTFFGST